MLSETLVTSTRAQQKSANTTIAKDIGIYVHTLHPTPSVKTTFKKSSTQPKGLAATSTHIFAAQAGKAVIHVYSRERGSQEALIAFPERIHSIVLIYDGLLALGTAEGRIVLWETFTGRQVSTPTSHLQAVSCMAATSQHLISGSEDANIHVWSIPEIMSLSSTDPPQPIRSLSNHRAPVTALAMGHGATNLNICVSSSKDDTCIIWNYNSGELLRTFLLPLAPLCLAVDPCDRALYIGFEDGSIRSIELFQPSADNGSLYDISLQSTPVQLASNPFSQADSTTELGAVHCLDVSYDGTSLYSGHESGKNIQWDTGLKTFSAEIADSNAPVTNLLILSPLPDKSRVKAINIIKPRLGEGNYAFTAQLQNSREDSEFEMALHTVGIPSEMLEVITEFSEPMTSSSASNEQLKKENEDLWSIVYEQRALQKRTYEKYLDAKGGH